MAKLLKLHGLNDEQKFLFMCPGCNCYHMFDGRWAWNGDMDRPTFSPSLGVFMGTEQQCHSFVRDGRIEFLTDSRHHLAGQTVEMLDEPGDNVSGDNKPLSVEGAQ